MNKQKHYVSEQPSPIPLTSSNIHSAQILSPALASSNNVTPPILISPRNGASEPQANLANNNTTTSRNLKDIYHQYELNNLPMALVNHDPRPVLRFNPNLLKLQTAKQFTSPD